MTLFEQIQKWAEQRRLTPAHLKEMVAPFVLCNGSCVALAYLCLELTSWYPGFVGIYIGLVLRGFVMVSWLELVELRRDHGQHRMHKENDTEKEPLLLQIFQTLKLGMAETLTIYWVLNSSWLAQEENHDSFLVQWLWFVPKSFVWEIIFDLFHYSTHRMAHMNKTLYKLVHYDHHLHEKPGPLSTFNMTLADHVLTNMLPAMLAFRLCGLKFSIFQLHLILTYKTSVEIGGHSGLDDANWHSFLQFPFLVRIFPFLLYTAKDHDLHHSRFTCNFAKRFKIWDIVFGTYESHSSIAQKRLDRRVDTLLAIQEMSRQTSVTTTIQNMNVKRKQTILHSSCCRSDAVSGFSHKHSLLNISPNLSNKEM